MRCCHSKAETIVHQLRLFEVVYGGEFIFSIHIKPSVSHLLTGSSIGSRVWGTERDWSSFTAHTWRWSSCLDLMQMTNAYRFNTPSACRQRLTLMQLPQAIEMVHFHSLKQLWDAVFNHFKPYLKPVAQTLHSACEELGVRNRSTNCRIVSHKLRVEEEMMKSTPVFILIHGLCYFFLVTSHFAQ